jgi:hypothetical protein
MSGHARHARQMKHNALVFMAISRLLFHHRSEMCAAGSEHAGLAALLSIQALEKSLHEIGPAVHAVHHDVRSA